MNTQDNLLLQVELMTSDVSTENQNFLHLLERKFEIFLQTLQFNLTSSQNTTNTPSILLKLDVISLGCNEFRSGFVIAHMEFFGKIWQEKTNPYIFSITHQKAAGGSCQIAKSKLLKGSFQSIEKEISAQIEKILKK